MAHCMQIGLAGLTEYLYLVGGLGGPSEPLKALPDGFAPPGEDWIYYGVDADPSSIDRVLMHYAKRVPAEQLKLVCACLTGEKAWKLPNLNRLEQKSNHPTDTPTALAEIVSWFYASLCEIDRTPQKSRIYVPTLTLDTLFSELGIETLDVLAVDIEGNEHAIFESYSWKMMPRFLTVEVHFYADVHGGMSNKAAVSDFRALIPEPYALYHHEAFPAAYELQFLLKE